MSDPEAGLSGNLRGVEGKCVRFVLVREDSLDLTQWVRSLTYFRQDGLL